MKELVVISGKGGTGKTSVTASFAALVSTEGKAVFADCDVDAADLHLIFSPEIREKTPFISGREAVIDPETCTACGKCAELCRFDAVRAAENGKYRIAGCEGCGLCVRRCPAGAISFQERRCGEWYVSSTRFGILVHAALDAEAENSGKLVSVVRKKAREIAEAEGADYILVDGCPGIGCPVIASITGADAVLAVAEPSLSSRHDLERVIALTEHFGMPLFVCVNKCDINTSISSEIKELCERRGVKVVGELVYDRVFTAAQLRAKSVVEYDGTLPVSRQLADVWRNLCRRF